MTRRPYVRPTMRQRQYLATLVEAGTQVDAAQRMGISLGGFHSAMSKIRARTGMTTVQAVYLGLRDGWLIVREDELTG